MLFYYVSTLDSEPSGKQKYFNLFIKPLISMPFLVKSRLYIFWKRRLTKPYLVFSFYNPALRFHFKPNCFKVAKKHIELYLFRLFTKGITACHQAHSIDVVCGYTLGKQKLLKLCRIEYTPGMRKCETNVTQNSENNTN